jgi:heavy metal sensor kinase
MTELRELRQAFFIVGPAILAIATLGGYRLARRSLDPVDQMTRAAARISASRLEDRLSTGNPNDELGRLAATLNAMIDRLEHSLTELRAFTADAAHEFRTPLTVIRNAAEVALMSARSSDYYEKCLNGILEETARLTALSNQLLVLAREDAGLDRQSDAVLNWSQLVQSIVDDLDPLFEERCLTVEPSEWPVAFVRGDAERLRRVLLNLFDNAIKYTPVGGHIAVRLELASHVTILTISDTGVGIPAEDLSRVFERFFRSDASRTRETGGSGLGLAICKAIIERHDGTIHVVSEAGTGTTVRIELPAVRIEAASGVVESSVVSFG